jgi:hypothetical protein
MYAGDMEIAVVLPDFKNTTKVTGDFLKIYEKCDH